MKLRLLRVVFFAFYFYAVLFVLFESLLIFTDADERDFYDRVNAAMPVGTYRTQNPEVDKVYGIILRSYAKGESPRFVLLNVRLLEVLYYMLIPFSLIIMLQYILVGRFNMFYSLRRNNKV